MSSIPERNVIKEIMKDIILKLHDGLPITKAKERFEKEIGSITSTEIADIEQGLIDDGLSPDEIKKFCNVHALLFQSELEKAAKDETFSSHPVYLFKQENREIEKRTQLVKEIIQSNGKPDLLSVKNKLMGILEELTKIGLHFERKEQILFPFLEKQGFTGPSKVMWGKDNEIRHLLKTASSELIAINTVTALREYINKTLNFTIEEINGMIFKEENILFPASLEKLSPSDWVEILRESDEIGYVFIAKPADTDHLVDELKAALLEETVIRDNAVVFPTGILNMQELLAIFNTLPVDMTFVDNMDTVRYFSESKGRIFRRTKSIIGRKVQNCHPPQSVHVVEQILDSFKKGAKDFYEFWIKAQGKVVYIRYFALRDQSKTYLGTLEVTQDITAIKKIKGEKRLTGD